jgi:hypothetical protein
MNALFVFLLAADALTATQIADKARSQGNALGVQNATARLTLRITTPSKEVRVRELAMKSKRTNGLNRALVRFLSPPDVAGTAFLSVENQGRDNEQFLYLPALGKAKRIGAGQRGQSFVGTDFSYGDIDARYLQSANAQRLGDDTSGGVACYVLDSVLGEGDYSRAKVWIAESDFVVRRVEFYDKANVLWKVLTVSQVKDVDGHAVIAASLMEDKKRGSQTEAVLGAIDFKTALDDSEFTEKSLSRG